MRSERHAAAPAVAPSPTGEVTATDRDPASTGRAEVIAPTGPQSSPRAAMPTSRELRRPGAMASGGWPAPGKAHRVRLQARGPGRGAGRRLAAAGTIVTPPGR